VRRLSSLGLRNFRRHFGRFALTAVGVAIGVSTFFAVLITNASLDHELGRVFSSGPFVYVQDPGGLGNLPTDTVRQAARLPDVDDVSGGIGFDVEAPHGKSLYLQGFTFVQNIAKHERPRGSDIVLRGREPADGGNEIVLGQGAAALFEVHRGSVLTLPTPKGAVPFTVVGVNERRDGHPNPGQLMYTSLSTVQRLLGVGDVVRNEYIRVSARVDPTVWAERHAADLPNLRLVPPDQGRGLRDALEIAKASLAGLAGLALFVSGYLIYLTLSLAVLERARVYGTLRALGADRAQVRRVVLVEALGLCAVGIPIGVALGFVTSIGLVHFIARLHGFHPPPTIVRPVALVAAISVGVVVTLASALLPARRAARVAPVSAIRGPGLERRPALPGIFAGAVLLVAGVAASQVHSRQRVDAGSIMVMAGAVFLVPLVMGPVARGAGRITRRMAEGVGTVGVMHLVRERRRSSSALALLMVVLAMVLTASSVQSSLRHNLVETISRRFPADLSISASGPGAGELGTRVRAVPGVRATTDLRFGQVRVTGRQSRNAGLVVIDPTTFFTVQGFPWARGNDASARTALERGGSVLIPNGFSRTLGTTVGGSVTLTTSRGPLPFRVAGIYRTFEREAFVVMGLRDAREFFLADDPDVVAAAVTRGSDPAVVRARVQRVLGPTAFVRLTSEQKADFEKGQKRFFRLVDAVILIAVIMGLLGLANTLAVGVLLRTREIGILRAVGVDRRQVRRLVVVESTTIVLVALALAVPLGTALSLTVLKSSTATLGIVVGFVYPWRVFPVLAFLSAAVAVLAALLPARRAAAVDPVRSLRFD
jgi:putative ABC transport system permease protein